MIRSKATAALMRLKEMDKKYKVRCKDQNQELSSDNTESLLEQAEYENTKIESTKTIPLIPSEKQEIFKPTLNIKIPDTYTEQLKSHSMSDKASPSLRVSVIDKTPVATPRVESQSISEIQEELDDAESIAEALEDSDLSRSEVTRQSHEFGVKRPESENFSLPITAEGTSRKKKQSQNYEHVSKDVQSNDYSHDSFESYSSVAKSSSFTHSQKKESKSKIVSPSINVYEGNDSIPVFNTGKDDELFKKEEMLDTEQFVESIEKETKTVISKDIDTTDERDKIVEELSMSNKATDSTVSKLDAQTTHKDVKICGTSEKITDSSYEKFSSEQSKQKKLNINENENQQVSSTVSEEILSHPKLESNRSKQDSKIAEKDGKTEELSSTLKDANLSQEESEENQSRSAIPRNTGKLVNEKESSSLKNKKLSRAKSGQRRNKHNISAIADQDNSETLLKSFDGTTSSSARLGRDPRRPEDLEHANETENDERLSSSAKDTNSRVGKFDNDETVLSVSEKKTKRPPLQSLRRSKKHRRKSSDYSEGVGKVPEADAVESECSSRRLSSRSGKEHRVTLIQRAEEKGNPRTADKILRKSPKAIETGAANKRKNPTVSKHTYHYHRSMIREHNKNIRTTVKTPKSSTFCQVSEQEFRERNDRELERLKMRMSNLRLEQERQLMLCYMKDFEEDRERLLLWPNGFYCPGKSKDSIIKPLNFPNVLNYTKPDSTCAEGALILPDNHLTMLKDRLAEIRQWLKDQFILYRDYSEVAAAINARYVAETEKEGRSFNPESR